MLKAIFQIDPRSLALFRMAIATLLLVDLAIRATDLRVMYTDEGMFPRADMAQWFHPVWSWSFHSWCGSAACQAALFGIAGVLALALLVGFQSRVAVIGSWLLLISVQHRVQPILSGAEILLRLLLFWAMFLPLAQKWSLDSRRKRPPDAANPIAPVVSAATAAILIQMGLSWLFSAIFKTNGQWLRGETLALVFAHDFYTTPAGDWLLQYPGLLRVMTWGALAVEWAALLLFIPHAPRLRMLMIAALAALHLGIGLCLEVGLFAWVSLAGLTLFLPPEFWDRRLFKKSAHPRATPVTAPSFGLTVPQIVCLVCLIYVLAVNLNSLRSRPLAALGLSPERWMFPGKALGLSQRWGMFEEAPSKDGWHVAWAKLADGSEVDLLRDGAPVDGTRPSFPARQYPNHYWQKLFRELAYTDEKGFQLFRPPVCRFLCRNWNTRNPASKHVLVFELIYSMEPPGANQGPPVRESLLHLGSANL